jgi:hypothetical protein
MIDKAEVQRTLMILAGYSLVFSFVVCPLFWTAVFVPWDSFEALALEWISTLSHWWRVRAFLIASFFASVPLGIYWFLARAWLFGGAPVWPVHVTCLFVVAPLSFFWFSVIAGPTRNFLSS